jgi:hypothetical protein
VPAAVVGVCANAGDADTTASPISDVAMNDLNMIGFLNCRGSYPHLLQRRRDAASFVAI